MALKTCMKLPLDQQDLNPLVLEVKDFAISHGMLVRTRDQPANTDLATHGPITLLPSPVPKACFVEACQIQTDFNYLIHRISHDIEFLRECLESTIKVDEFTRRLWEIYETVHKEGFSQPICLGMVRSDYMLGCGLSSDIPTAHTPEYVDPSTLSLKQIEINTIAAGAGCLATKTGQCHRYILEECGKYDLLQNMPENRATDHLAHGIVVAWQQYGNPEAAVLFLVHSVERNFFDQKLLEYGVKVENRKIKVIRATFQDVQQRGHLTDTKALVLDGHEVAVIYCRALYTPGDFQTEQDWATRLMLERSRVIMCPNIGYQLAGTKKVQQVLVQPGILERFLSDPAIIQRLRNTFAQQYGLDPDEEGDKAIEMAMANPEKFVLKPQREGGGNNVFGRDIIDVLSRIKNSDERRGYILMERIVPAYYGNYKLISARPVKLANMVSELGIFGTIVGTPDNIMLNAEAGHLLRSKPLECDEGGIMSETGAVDSPYLI